MLSTTSYLILALILFGPLFYKPHENEDLPVKRALPWGEESA